MRGREKHYDECMIKQILESQAGLIDREGNERADRKREKGMTKTAENLERGRQRQ